MSDTPVPSISSDAEAIQSGTSKPDLWLKKIQAAKDEEAQWLKDAREAEEAYEADDKAKILFNVLHSNVETLVPALYNSSPVPDVRRRYGDADPIGKQVVDVVERLISESCDAYDIDQAFKATVKDSAVVGRGIIRIRYEADVNGEMKGSERLYSERVPWDKFIRGPARAWEQVPWIAFEHDLTKDELEKLSPGYVGTLDAGGSSEKKIDERTRDPKGITKTYRVYEVWNREDRTVFFVADKDKEKFAKDPVSDPLGLTNFFPTPRPVHPATRLSSLVPLCPYNVVKPLMDELQTITRRIDKLIRQLRVRGLYDAKLEADVDALKSCDDGQYEAAKNTEVFAASGGLEKAVAHWPMDPTVKALQQLYQQRDQVRALIDQVAGVSDILRGQVDPREKLGQSQIKTQWGSIRIQDWQNSVAAMARELFRMKTEIFAKHFSDQNISETTGLPATQEQRQMWPQVMQVFRSQMRSYRIDIETDSTIRADMTRNQEQMNTFLAGTAQFATAMAGIIQIPNIGEKALPVIVEVFTAFARKFKLGKQAEDALDKLSVDVQQAQQQPQEAQPDQAAEKAKAELQVMQQKAQIEGQAMQAKAQHDERVMQLKEREAQLKVQIAEIDLQIKRESAQIDLQMRQQAVVDKAEQSESARQERADMLSHTAQMNDLKMKQANQPRPQA